MRTSLLTDHGWTEYTIFDVRGFAYAVRLSIAHATIETLTCSACARTLPDVHAGYVNRARTWIAQHVAQHLTQDMVA